MIRVEGLKKSFNANAVLCGVDLEIVDGENVVVIGRSGGGKSVLVKHLCGLLKPDAGKVVVDDEDIVPLDEDELPPIRRKFGVLFQGAALFDSMTVFENVAFPLREERKPTEEEIEEQAMRALKIVDLEMARDKKPAELSGGMRKRVGLARAIVRTPKYLLYDEPTTGLDPIRADSINRLIIRLRDEFNVTGVAVTHDIVSAYKIANKIALLHEGRIYIVGTPKEIEECKDPVVWNFVHGVSENEEVSLG